MITYIHGSLCPRLRGVGSCHNGVVGTRSKAMMKLIPADIIAVYLRGRYGEEESFPCLWHANWS